MPGFNINSFDSNSVSNTKEFLWQHRWLIDSLGTDINKKDALVAKEVTLPDLRMERQEVLGGLVWYKFAKAVKWDDAVVTFYDDSAVNIKVDAWRKKVYTEDGGILQHTAYKQDSVFSLLDGNGDTVKKITLKNSWPANISQGRLTYTDSDFKYLVVTLAFDWAEILEVKTLESMTGQALGAIGAAMGG